MWLSRYFWSKIKKLINQLDVLTNITDSLAFLDEVRDKNTWYLADSTQPLQVPAQTVMVSSPQPKAYKKFKKFGGRNRFMPVWTYKEIEHCRKVNQSFTPPTHQLAPTHNSFFFFFFFFF
jgi:hypothetical protein